MTFFKVYNFFSGTQKFYFDTRENVRCKPYVITWNCWSKFTDANKFHQVNCDVTLMYFDLECTKAGGEKMSFQHYIFCQ